MASTYTDRINGVETSMAIKAPALVATTVAITLSGLQTIDGVTVAAGDRVLVKNQTDQRQNGIWDVSSTAWTRSLDFDGARDIMQGTLVYVVSGSFSANTTFVVSSSGRAIGVDVITFDRLDGIYLGPAVGAFDSYAAAEAEFVAENATRIYVVHNGMTLAYNRDSSSTALTTADGATWGPAGEAYLQHWGLVTYSSETAALAAAAAMTSGARVIQQDRLEAAFGESAGTLVIKGFIEAFDQLTANPARTIRLFSGADFNGICFHYSRMNMSAVCAFQAGTTAGGGCVVESLHLLFDQTAAATSGNDADIKAYPRAFDCAGDWGTLNYLRISRGNNGFAAARTDSANNGGWKIGRIESGCFGRDIEFNGALHFIDAADIDLWPQGFAGNANLLALYKARAATTKKVYIGRNDGLTIGRLGIFAGGIVEIDGDVVAGSGLPILISALQLDADGASLLLTSGRSEIGRLYATESASAPQRDYKVKCVGGTHAIAQSDFVGDATPLVQVDGGTLTLSGRLYNTNLTVGQLATVSAGALNLQDCQFVWPTGARSVPAIEQSGTGVLRIIGGTVEAATAGELAKFSTDVAGNFVEHGAFFPHAVTVPSGAHIGNYGRNQRADWVERAAAGWRAMPGEMIWADGVPYVGSSGATAISDLPGMLPAMWVSPDHFGGKTKAQIEAAIAYHQTICGTSTTATTAASTALPIIFGSGLHNSGGAAITYATAGVETVIKGQGRATRLNNVTFQIGDHRCEISDFAMEGNAKATDAFSFTPRGGNLRGGLVQNVHIQGARYGLYSTGDVAWLRFNHIYAEKNTRGFQFDRVIGFTTEFCQFTTSDEQGGLILRGGEYRDIGSRFNGNKKAGLRFDGSAATGISQIVVENYLNGTSISGNYTDAANRPTWSITGAASNGDGGTRLTLNVSGARHKLSDGISGVVIAGTTDYNGSWKVTNVTNTTVDISAAYTSSQTGTIKHPGYDLEAIGDAGIRSSQLNDLWVANCNINTSYFKDCFGVRIDGGRPKVQLFLDGGCYGFSRVSNGRGRLSDTVDDGDEDGISGTWSPVPFSGQNYGFVENISSVADAFTGEVSMITRAPDPLVDLIGNNIQAYNGMTTNGSDGTTFDGPVTFLGGVTFDLPDDVSGLVSPTIASRLGSSTARPFVFFVGGQSGALGAGEGQPTEIIQASGGTGRTYIYSDLGGGPSGTMVEAAYGTAPLNRVLHGGGATSTVPEECTGNIGPHAANAIRRLQATDPNRDIYILVAAEGGQNIDQWVDPPYRLFTAFTDAMAKISADYGETLTIDHIHWDQGQGNGTTAGPYNTVETYLPMLDVLYGMFMGSDYCTPETTWTSGELISVRPYVASDTGAIVRSADKQNEAIRQWANGLKNPKVAMTSSWGFRPAGDTSGDNNHPCGEDIAKIGDQIGAAYIAMRAGAVLGAHIKPDGRPLLNYPQKSYVGGETVLLGLNDVDTGHLFIRSGGANIKLPFISNNNNAVIRIDVWSASDPTIVTPPLSNKTIAGPQGDVSSVTLGLGQYEFWWSGEWKFAAVSPKVGDFKLYAPASLLPQEVKGLSQPETRGLALNSFAGCLIGLPPPDQGSQITIVQRSLTTYGAATLGRACNAAIIAAGGTGYTVGDVLQCALGGGGASGSAPTVTVTAVEAGVVTGVAVLNRGCITSNTTPTSPAATTGGTGTGATITLTYSSAQILGPGVSDTAYSYSLDTINQVVKLEAIGSAWRVIIDTSSAVQEVQGTWTPVFSNSTPGDLSVVHATQIGTYKIHGNMMWIECSLTFTATFTTAAGAWTVAGAPDFAETYWQLECRHSSGITMPASKSNMILVPSSTTLLKLRTATTDTDLPVANVASGTAISLKFAGWVPLS